MLIYNMNKKLYIEVFSNAPWWDKDVTLNIKTQLNYIHWEIAENVSWKNRPQCVIYKVVLVTNFNSKHISRLPWNYRDLELFMPLWWQRFLLSLGSKSVRTELPFYIWISQTWTSTSCCNQRSAAKDRSNTKIWALDSPFMSDGFISDASKTSTRAWAIGSFASTVNQFSGRTVCYLIWSRATWFMKRCSQTSKGMNL